MSDEQGTTSESPFPMTDAQYALLRETEAERDELRALLEWLAASEEMTLDKYLAALRDAVRIDAEFSATGSICNAAGLDAAEGEEVKGDANEAEA